MQRGKRILYAQDLKQQLHERLEGKERKERSEKNGFEGTVQQL